MKTLEIEWRRVSDTTFEAFVDGAYAGFVTKHGSWRGCVFTAPFVKFRYDNKYEYNHGAGKTKDDLIAWVADTINTKSYLLNDAKPTTEEL